MKIIVSILMLLFSLELEVYAEKLHVILAGDTLSKDINDHVGTNIYWLGDGFRRNIPKDQLQITELSHQNLKWSKISDAIKHSNVGNDDTILFYYCGHGYWDERGGNFFPLKNENNKRVYFKHINEHLSNKRPRLSIVINDSCNAEITGPIIRPAPDKFTHPRVVTPSYNALFFQSFGSVHINSSSPGEYALCMSPLSDGTSFMAGSIFTSSLGKLLHSPTLTTWKSMHYALKKDVNRRFIQLKTAPNVKLSNEIRQQNTQRIQTLINGKEI